MSEARKIDWIKLAEKYPERRMLIVRVVVREMEMYAALAGSRKKEKL